MSESNVLDRHSAPSSAAGFDFQFQRALLELIYAKNGDVVGIETLDDVAVIGADGTQTLEQDKFTTNDAGSVYGDKTHNLLNTLSTWLKAALNGELDCAKTRFRLVTNARCSSGLVRDISDCKSVAAAVEILKKVRALKSESREFQLLIQLLNEAEAEDLFCAICVSAELLDGENDIAQKVQDALPVEEVYASNRQHIYLTLLGWLHASAYTAWQKKRPYFVARQSFVNELGAIKDRLRRSTHREKPPSDLPVTQVAMDGLANQMFVRQIKLVSDDQDESYEARADYLRCISEKSRLVEEGVILERDWLDFDMGLEDRWKLIFRQRGRLSRPEMSERDVGYDIMSTTISDQDAVKLAGAPITYSYLAKGSYHRLSNALKVGWHPRFKELLQGNDYA